MRRWIRRDMYSKLPVYLLTYFYTHTVTHTRLTVLCPGLPGWAGTRKVKPIWILVKQETLSGSGISWAICKSPPRSRQITTPWSGFLQDGCPSCHPTNSVKALNGNDKHSNIFKCKRLQLFLDALGNLCAVEFGATCILNCLFTYMLFT